MKVFVIVGKDGVGFFGVGGFVGTDAVEEDAGNDKDHEEENERAEMDEPGGAFVEGSLLIEEAFGFFVVLIDSLGGTEVLLGYVLLGEVGWLIHLDKVLKIKRRNEI